MNYVWKHLKRYKKEAILAPLFKMLEALFDLFVPLVVANIINIGIKNGDQSYIIKQIGLLVLLALVGITCSVVAQYFAARASVKTASNIRKELFSHIETLSYKELDTLGNSTLVTRMTSDINLIQNENTAAYTRDNAISALGKYLYFQSDLDDKDKAMFTEFLKMLPLKEDLEESKAVFQEFVNQINSNNPIVANDANIPFIKESLIRFKELNDQEHFLEESEILLREICAKFGI